MKLNQILRNKRKEFNLTQEQLAEKLFVSSKTISNWETGKTFPDIESLIRISQLYHLSLDNLLVEGSDVVKDIEKKTRLASLKKYIWVPSILNILLVLIVSQQRIIGKLTNLTTGLLLVAIALNSVVIVYFSKELSTEKEEEPEFRNQQQLKGLIAFLILFGLAVLFGYLRKYYF